MTMVRTANGHAKKREPNRAHRLTAEQLRPPATPAPLNTVANGATVAPAPAPATAPADRTEAGRFAPGNRAAVGRRNAFSRKLGSLREAFVSAAASEEQVAQVGRKLLELATAGDVQAAALYLSYALGKPGKVVDVDRLDLDELSIGEAAPSVASIIVTLSAIRTEGALEALQNMGGGTSAEVTEAIARAFMTAKDDGYKLVRDVQEETAARCRRRNRA
jgi:hypothetical protein